MPPAIRCRRAFHPCNISSKETNYRGDNSSETDMARPFRISHRGGRAKILIDPFLSDNRPGTKGGSATVQARTRHREVTDEGDCGDGSGCGNGRDEAGGAARAAGGEAR